MKQFGEKYIWAGIILLITIIQPAAILAQDDIPSREVLLQPQSLESTGIYSLKEIDPILNGTGVKFAIISRSFTYFEDEPQNDYRPAINHNCFLSKDFIFRQNDSLSWGISPHSTAICSILFGEDPDAYHPLTGPFYYEGVVPQAQVTIFEFVHFLNNNVFKHSPPNADIITAAFGRQFEDWWTRGIESLVEKYGLVVVAGIGNGTNVTDPVLYPAAGSNIIGVGVVNSVNTEDLLTNLANFTLAYPENSSAGPTGDGRCKPDIVAPGNCLAADIFEPNQYEPTGNWSSFSTPIVAGAIGLLVQKAKQEPDLSMAISPYGGNCVIKAIIMNSATKLPFWHKGNLKTDDDHYAPLDYIQGAGMLNALNAYNHLVAGQQKPGEVSNTGWDLNQLDKKVTTSNVYKITINEPADKYITVTLSWNRHYDNCYPFNALPEKDNDLGIELWAIDELNPENTYLLDYSDSAIDNIEHIYIPADPNYTNYEIVLSIDNVQNPLNNIQRYGLAWNVSPKQDKNNTLWFDLNADGSIDNADLTIMYQNRMNSVKSSDEYLIGDIDLDGKIDISDLAILFENLDSKNTEDIQESDILAQN